jgi:hypothetical protein
LSLNQKEKDSLAAVSASILYLHCGVYEIVKKLHGLAIYFTFATYKFMELKDIVSISGKPGLQKVISRRSSGFIVETMDGTGKKFPTSFSHKVSILEDISIYTYEDDVPLGMVFKSLDEKVKEGLNLITKKNSGEEIRDFFRQVLPEFDEDQVYVSDIIKVANWYKMLEDDIDFAAYEVKEAEEESVEKEGDKDVAKDNSPE